MEIGGRVRRFTLHVSRAHVEAFGTQRRVPFPFPPTIRYVRRIPEGRRHRIKERQPDWTGRLCKKSLLFSVESPRSLAVYCATVSGVRRQTCFRTASWLVLV